MVKIPQHHPKRKVVSTSLPPDQGKKDEWCNDEEKCFCRLDIPGGMLMSLITSQTFD